MNMECDADIMSNVCTDLVSLRRMEPAISHLLRDHPAGVWVPVADLYAQTEVSSPTVSGELQAAWLPAPQNANYAVIVFFDDESKWSMTAEYDAMRLLGRQILEPISAAG